MVFNFGLMLYTRTLPMNSQCYHIFDHFTLKSIDVQAVKIYSLLLMLHVMSVFRSDYMGKFKKRTQAVRYDFPTSPFDQSS